MSLEKFEQHIFTKLRRYAQEQQECIEVWLQSAYRSIDEYTPEKDMKEFLSTIKKMYASGFTVQDAYRYFICTEEMDPRTPEDLALSRMAKIESKYSMSGKKK